MERKERNQERRIQIVEEEKEENKEDEMNQQITDYSSLDN